MEDQIQNSVEIHSPITRVWKALTDYREFGQWFGVKLEGNFLSGEESKGYMTHPGYEHIPWKAVIQKIAPQELFSFTWHPYAIETDVDYSHETPTLVEFRLKEVPPGTELTVIETGFDKIPDSRRDQAYKMHVTGWTEQMKNIRNHLQ